MDLTLAICVYNKEDWIAETLDSVMSQTAQGFNLLIIDDASTDRSVEVIEAYFRQYPRQYTLICLESNHGIGYCRYLAERKASTRYLMFLDSDDVLLPTAVAKMWAKMQSDGDLMAVGCHLAYVDQNTSLIGVVCISVLQPRRSFMNVLRPENLCSCNPQPSMTGRWL